MSELNNYSKLKELKWTNIPGVDFIMKYKFSDEGYSILVTNLKEIFGENINENEVQRRFSDLNVHAKMKTSVIMRNLEKCLDMALTGNDLIFKLESFEKSIRIQVQFIVNRASLIFNFEPCLLSFNQLRSHILVPTLSHALLIYQENIALKKRLIHLESKLESASKDMSLDYKKNSNAFNLLNNTNVSDAVIVDSFLDVQSDMQACFAERKFIYELWGNNLPESPVRSEVMVKKEISEPSIPFQYDENAEELDRKDSALLQLPVKREISELSSEGPNEDNIAEADNQTSSSLNLEKTKKKSFKF